MSRTIVTVEGVHKQFGRVCAVDDLSFEVREREIFALLGPNGAGKSTLVRMLMGILQPDRGSIAYGLGVAGSWPSPAELGYLPEDRGLYRDTPILRTLTYFGVLRGMERAASRRAAAGWLDRLGLADRASDKLDALSKGNQQKVQFAAAVLHEPAFAVLDEPFSGLDPVNQDLFLDLVRGLRDAGMTILLSAHQMQLVERVADRILLVDRGREALSGSLAEVRARAQAGARIVLRCDGPVDLPPIAGHPAVASAELSDDGQLTLLVRPGETLSDLLVTVGRHTRITAIHSEPLSLHDIYVQAVEPEAPAAAAERS